MRLILTLLLFTVIGGAAWAAWAAWWEPRYAGLLIPEARAQCITYPNGSVSIGCGMISGGSGGSGGTCSNELDFSQSCNSQYLVVVH